jgi:Sulfotransferase family
MSAAGTMSALRTPQPKTVRSQAPVFVIGCSRSGTTLLYHMILSSGNFAVYRMESHVFTLLEPRFRPLSVPENKRKLLDAWYQTRLFARSGLTAEDIEPQVMGECQNGGDFLRIQMEAMCRKQGVERWAETTPEHLLYIRRIKQTIPNALVIHVIRDGRDVASSWEKLSQIRRLPGDRTRAAMAAGLYWEWIVNQGREAGRELGGDYIEVHYEDLVRRPEDVLQRLHPFLEHDLDYDRISQVAIGSVAAPNTAFKDERSPIGRWKQDFTADERATFEALVGGTLSDLGYEIESRSPGSRSLNLAAMRAAYRLYFESKQYLKTKSRMGKWLVTRDLSWV